MKILLDTCVIIWAVSEPEKLSKKCKEELVRPENKIYISPISAAELACAQERGKIKIDRHWKLWLRYFKELNDWDEIPIDLRITEEAYSLPEPFHQDPADRVLAATTRVHGLVLATGDDKLIGNPHVETVW